jgi:tRNA G10  N-methylase Trm11
MSKKYIIFKLFDNLNDSCENEILSKLELSAFLDEFELLQNIFQLQQYPDLKLLINKSEDLQHLLTQKLPGQGLRHGYLWSGEDFGNITEILAKIALIRECFIFQKSTDPLPSQQSDVYFQLTHKMEIYNWYIFHVYTFQYFLNAANKIRYGNNSEIEIDREFNKLWDDTKFKAISEKTNGLTQLDTKPVNQIQYSFLNLDKRAYVKNPDNRWVRALVSYLAPYDKQHIYHPFCGTGDSMLESLIAGKNVTGAEINPVRTGFANTNLAAFNIALPDLLKAISTIISQLKILINSNDETQTDLFLSSAEKQFDEFWESEKERIRSLKFDSEINDNAKIIAAIRFLIESKIISKSQDINDILLTGLINLIALLLRKRTKNDSITSYHRELRQIYLDIYTFHKIKQLTHIPMPAYTVLNENALKTRTLRENSFDAVVCYLPTGIKNSGFNNDQRIFDILNFDINTVELELQKLGNQSALRGRSATWVDDLLKKGSMFSLLGPYAQNLLTRFYNPKKQNETAAFFKLWIDYYYFLLEIQRVLKNHSSLCLIVKHPYIKIEERVEEFKISQIIREFLEIHQTVLSLKLTQTISKPVAYTHFGHLRYVHILIISKESESLPQPEPDQ